MANSVTLLLANNDPGYREGLRRRLVFEGYKVVEADSVATAEEKLRDLQVDLFLVDLKMQNHSGPDTSGLELARTAAAQGVPSIVITSFEDEEEAMRLALRTLGRRALAEDFIMKGKSHDAILNAIATVLANIEENDEPSHGLTIDLEKGLPMLNGQPLSLSAQQHRLLEYLYRKDGAVCTAQELIRAVYDEELAPEKASSDKRLERRVARLRDKIEEDRSQPKYLITVPGRGYRLVSQP